MDPGIAGQGFLVTGGSSGIGLATARLLLQEGAAVTVCARNPQRLKNAAADMVALRDDQLRAQLRDRERRVQEGFAEVIEGAADKAGMRLSLPAHDVAVVLLALGEGITRQHQLAPDQVDADCSSPPSPYSPTP